MLSDNIEALAGALEKYRDTGAIMEADAVRDVCAVLSSCAEDARRMEAMIRPPRDLPPEVVDLAGRRAASVWKPCDGGDVA